MKPIVLEEHRWEKIYQKIKLREKPSTYLSRDRMKTVLGFTIRRHTDFNNEYVPILGDRDPIRIHLDFYDEQKRVMFLLKYGENIE